MSRFLKADFILVALLLMLILVTVLMGGRLATTSRSSLSCIVEDDRTGGGSGIRAWADAMGFSTLPMRAPLWEIQQVLPGTGHCVLTAGNRPWSRLGHEFTDDLWQPISLWIRSGNTLVVITSNVDSLPDPITKIFTAIDGRVAEDESPVPSFEPSKSEWRFSLPQEPERVPTRWGGNLQVKSEGSRLKNIPTEWVIAGSENRCVLAGKTLDQGMIYLLLDDAAWSNESFDLADNAATLARLLHQHLLPVGVLGFDEYRHGHGRIESFISLFLSLPGAQSFSLMGLCLGLFWLWGNSRRLSPPDEFHEIERRTSQEYMESVAAMNQRARAAPLVVNSVLNRVQSLLQKRGVRGALEEAEQELLQRARSQIAAAERPVSPQKEIKLVTELLQLREDRYGTGQGS